MEAYFDNSATTRVLDKVVAAMDEMMTELLKFIAGVNNPFYKLVLSKLFIDDEKFAEAFKNLGL